MERPKAYVVALSQSKIQNLKSKMILLLPCFRNANQ
jgi:hypothetical protein